MSSSDPDTKSHKDLAQTLSPHHANFLESAWGAHPAIPSVASRKAFALAHNLSPSVVHKFFWKKKTYAVRKRTALEADGYELGLPDPLLPPALPADVPVPAKLRRTRSCRPRAVKKGSVVDLVGKTGERALSTLSNDLDEAAWTTDSSDAFDAHIGSSSPPTPLSLPFELAAQSPEPSPGFHESSPASWSSPAFWSSSLGPVKPLPTPVHLSRTSLCLNTARDAELSPAASDVRADYFISRPSSTSSTSSESVGGSGGDLACVVGLSNDRWDVSPSHDDLAFKFDCGTYDPLRDRVYDNLRYIPLLPPVSLHDDAAFEQEDDFSGLVECGRAWPWPSLDSTSDASLESMLRTYAGGSAVDLGLAKHEPFEFSWR